MASDGGSIERWFLVSGGSGGIGSAVCAALAERGYKPIVGYHQSAATARRIAESCGGVPLELNLRDPRSIEAAVAFVENAPYLAGVVLAGSPPLSVTPFCKITPAQLQEQLEVNVVGPQLLLAELVRRCFRRQKQGSVVGVLSRAMGDEQSPAASGMGAYVIAKHGMAGMLALLAADYPWLQVRSIKPSYTETRMLEAFDERFLALQRERTPFQTPEAVAALILEQAISS